MLATFDHSEFEPGDLLARKRETVTVCLPTRETAETIGVVVTEIEALRDLGLVDQVVVVDADSADGTAAAARAAGAEVFSENELMASYGPARGKGDAMWRALSVATGEIVVYLDGDVRDFGGHYVTGLLGPLLISPKVEFAKGFYRRPLTVDSVEIEDGGGRVTELTAKPLLELLAPELAAFRQPLAGEVAARRSLLESIPYATGYGVEIAMLVDVWRAGGLDRMAQVGLGSKRNSHQALADLAGMAREVIEALFTRVGAGVAARASAGNSDAGDAAPPLPPATRRRLETRPPMAEQTSPERLTVTQTA
jgi:glucosyl-3-phosphoglycerate synthase